MGTIEKHQRDSFPGVIECELTPAGAELLFVAAALEEWLQGAPHGPVPFCSDTAKKATMALAEGWSSTILRVLAARPLSLTELDGVIGHLGYPSLERRLAAMRRTGQVEACEAGGNGIPHTVTDWVRRGMAPVAAAASWERRHLPDESPPIAQLDIEGAFLLVLPLLRLAPELCGRCQMGVETVSGTESPLAGAMAHVDRGRVLSFTVDLSGDADAWATGSATAWLHAVVCADTDGLEVGGDQCLAHGLLDGLHGALFGTAAPRRPLAQSA